MNFVKSKWMLSYVHQSMLLKRKKEEYMKKRERQYNYIKYIWSMESMIDDTTYTHKNVHITYRN